MKVNTNSSITLFLSNWEPCMSIVLVTLWNGKPDVLARVRNRLKSY